MACIAHGQPKVWSRSHIRVAPCKVRIKLYIGQAYLQCATRLLHGIA